MKIGVERCGYINILEDFKITENFVKIAALNS